MTEILKHQTIPPYQMRKVVLESPFAGDVEANLTYARACLRDCLMRGESPLASHALYTQPGILDDNDPHERAHGINAGHAWTPLADAVVVYTDRGISPGMAVGISVAEWHKKPIEYRSLEKQVVDSVRLGPEAINDALSASEQTPHSLEAT